MTRCRTSLLNTSTASKEVSTRAETGIAFLRSDAADRILVVIGRSEDPQNLAIPISCDQPKVIWGDGTPTETVSGTLVEGVRGAVLIRLESPDSTVAPVDA